MYPGRRCPPTIAAVELQSCRVQDAMYLPNPIAPPLIILATPSTTTPSPLNHRHQHPPPPPPPPLIVPSPALPPSRQSSRRAVHSQHLTLSNRFLSIDLFSRSSSFAGLAFEIQSCGLLCFNYPPLLRSLRTPRPVGFIGIVDSLPSPRGPAADAFSTSLWL